MNYLKPASDPERVIASLVMEHQLPIKRMYRPGYQGFMSNMPVIDVRAVDQSHQIAVTNAVLDEMAKKVTAALLAGDLELPKIEDGEFGRVILAIEEPTYNQHSGVISGAEVVLELWGRGFFSPVHNHGPGFMNERLLFGELDINIFEPTGDLRRREAVYRYTLEQRNPGVFYDKFINNVGANDGVSVIHNFRAITAAVSMHYLSEHVSDGVDNRFRVVNAKESGHVPSDIDTFQYKDGFELAPGEYKEVLPDDVVQKIVAGKYGSVYLVRSDNLPYLGLHYVVTTGPLVQKPYGLRPQYKTTLVPGGVKNPIDIEPIDQRTVRILELDPEAEARFKSHFNL